MYICINESPCCTPETLLSQLYSNKIDVKKYFIIVTNQVTVIFILYLMILLHWHT